jgi:hypothetical protein
MGNGRADGERIGDMSDNRRFERFVSKNGSALNEQPDVPRDSLAQTDNEIFGGQSSTGQRQVAKPISIFDIHPDPVQPRRAIPSVVLNSWNYGDPHVLYAYWLNFAEMELSGTESNGASEEWLRARVVGQYEEEWNFPDELGPVMRSLLEVADLAGSILRDGLTNPITVVQRGDQYAIETGERRWLAYQLLYEVTRDVKWSKIPARAVETFDVFRQAAENNQRQNLNAISRARQYAILLMAMHPQKEFAPYEVFQSDQAYYAQALDLNTPYGQSETLLNAMGVTHRSALTDMRTILSVPLEVWTAADDENWSARRILELLDTPNNSPKENNRPAPSRWISDEAHRAWSYIRSLDSRKRSADEKNLTQIKIDQIRKDLDEVERKLWE